MASAEPAAWHARGRHSAGRAAPGPADWLGLAATPSFALMAILSAVIGDGAAAILCQGAPLASLGGMAPMYGLMATFHAGPWLRLAAAAKPRRKVAISPI